MASGRKNKVTGQTGEYLVAAELSRRGLIATTFTGNVPHYDIIASDESGRHVSVQAKASMGGSWQFGDMKRFCDITFKGTGQIVGTLNPCPVQRLVVIFVWIQNYGSDRFYILPWTELQKILVDDYKDYLARHGGGRAKKWDSLHNAVSAEQLHSHIDQWDVVKNSLA